MFALRAGGGREVGRRKVCRDMIIFAIDTGGPASYKAGTGQKASEPVKQKESMHEDQDQVRRRERGGRDKRDKVWETCMHEEKRRTGVVERWAPAPAARLL